jgi:hypothetical protein
MGLLWCAPWVRHAGGGRARRGKDQDEEVPPIGQVPRRELVCEQTSSVGKQILELLLKSEIFKSSGSKDIQRSHILQMDPFKSNPPPKLSGSSGLHPFEHAS